MTKHIDIRQFDTGYGEFTITLDYDPFFIYVLKKLEKGDDIKREALSASGRYLPYVKKNIIEKYMTATKRRALTGENKIVSRTGGMKSSLNVRKNIKSNLEDSYVALMVNRNAVNKASGVAYPLALETGWRGYTKANHKGYEFYDTRRFIPPFHYAEESFLMSLDKFSKILLRAINTLIKDTGKKYISDNI
ncbi:MAG: hypothetical protein QXG00_06695 [Candidatus Woesearchaeota archaeon]